MKKNWQRKNSIEPLLKMTGKVEIEKFPM